MVNAGQCCFCILLMYFCEGLQTLQMKLKNLECKRRESNIELFRIITMLLVIAHHFVVNSGLIAEWEPMLTNALSKRTFFLYVFGAWGKYGINCFVLITGYYMCKSNITVEKFLKLLFEIIFYGFAVYLIFTITGYEVFSWGGLLRTLVPVKDISNGFASCYMFFFLLIPFLNILIQNLDKKKHLSLMLLLVFMYTVLGSSKQARVTFNYVTWFIVVYIIASYIRMYDCKLCHNNYAIGIVLTGFIMLSLWSVHANLHYIASTGIGTDVYFYIMDVNKVCAIGTAVCAFLFFRNLRVPYNSVINILASTCFGVLLIHTSSDAMRTWLWQEVLDVKGHYGSTNLIVFSISSICLIFSVCAVIDIVRQYVIEKPFMCAVNKLLDSFRKDRKTDGR